jgi:OOP family OmpA-OmpF porin
MRLRLLPALKAAILMAFVLLGLPLIAQSQTPAEPAPQPDSLQQEKEPPKTSPHSLAAKVLFLDHANPNGLSMENFPISNGLEFAYIRSISDWVNIAFPVKVSQANVEGFMNRRTLVGADAVLQLQYYKENAFLVPYVLGGGGVVSENFEMTNVQFPVGVGFNFRLGPNSYVNLQGEYRFSMADNRDNLQVGLGYVFRLGQQNKEQTPGDMDGDTVLDVNDECPEVPGIPALLGCPDTDGDGVADKIDECPDVQGPASTMGCPDKDEDGIADMKDECPDEPGTPENNGCPELGPPDRDKDGVVDEDDLCPDDPGTPAMKGCPDTDGDGLADNEDACPDIAGVIAFDGCPDTDGDGIPDKDDKCPDRPGTKARQGCPAVDTDGDGIVDDKDDCPGVPGPLTMGGCPDTDGDGLSDKDDRCPEEPGDIANDGCPKRDTDGDGVLDGEDDCPTVAGLLALNGCPDTDRDGIPDKDDACPEEKGPKERNGCPSDDADNDGVKDAADDCPNTPGPVETNGCPDTDGDGVPNNKDNCPNDPGPFNGCPDTDDDGIEDSKDNCPKTPGPVTNLGCPEIEKEEQEFLDFAMQAVNFETGSATLKADSYSILNKVAAILEKYPDFKLRIIGHTDNVGRDASNQQLSESRAKSCYEYILAQGVDAERISFLGKGETEPIATNDTSDGRELNRRVEFEIYAE